MGQMTKRRLQEVYQANRKEIAKLHNGGISLSDIRHCNLTILRLYQEALQKLKEV